MTISPVWTRLPGPSRDGRVVHWILRVALAWCFVGHGAFGIITKSDWLPFFAVFGIGPDIAYRLMPLIGTMDIALGILVLFRPMRATLAYMTFWCFWTALLRPLSGMSFFETLERAGNYGVPLALLAVAGSGPWLAAVGPVELDAARVRRLAMVLCWTTALLLVGHGGFGAVLQKPLLVAHLATVGAGSFGVLRAQGLGEILAGVTVLFAAAPWSAGLLMAWKVATELLYVLAGSPVWEFVERGGSYGAPLALAVLLRGARGGAQEEMRPAA